MWMALIPIIAQYGLPLAEKLVEKWSSKSEPTLADFAELRTLAQQDALSHVKARLTANGVPLDSPQAIELLKLVA